MQQQFQAKKGSPLLPIFILLWAVIVASFVILKQQALYDSYAGGLLILILILDMVAIGYTVWLWRHAVGKTKLIFALFALSFVCLFMNDVINNVAYNIMLLSHSQVSVDVRFLDNLAYLGCLFFQLLAWAILLPRVRAFTGKEKKLLLYIPLGIIIIAGLLVILLVSSLYSWTTDSMWMIIFDKLGIIFVVGGFVLALLCLATTKNKGLLIIALMYVIGMSSDLLMSFTLFTQQFVLGSFLESLWILLLLLTIYGFYQFKISATYTTDPKSWVYELNSIRVQTVFWTFAICILVLAIFFLLIYLLSPEFFLSNKTIWHVLPVILAICAVFTVTLANLFLRKLCLPFRRLEKLVDIFVYPHQQQKQPQEERYDILEFDHLEGFLLKAFATLEEKIAAEQKLVELATQVAHDIRSPLAALHGTLQQPIDIGEDSRKTMSEAISDINDIADKLLTKYRDTKV